MPTKTIKTETLYRSVEINQREIDQESRTVELAFSSEEPVMRWFGKEILDHSPSSVRLGRLQGGGPVLVDHDARDHVGVVESVSVDNDRRGRAVVRFGNSARASEIFQDVVDGIRKAVSVGYRVYKAVLEETGEDEPDVYRVTDWEPLEVSIVAVPADASVGVGRSGGETTNDMQVEIQQIEKPNQEDRKMPDENKTPAIDIQAVQDEARKAEQDRVRELLATGEAYKQFGGDELARQLVNSGGTVDDLNKALIERMGKSRPIEAEAPDIGMSEREAQQFSFVRAINALANPADRRAQELAAFEFEASRAAAEKMGRESRGITVPVDVLKRELTVGTPTAGGHTVATDLLAGSFIDLLRNRALMMNPGMATVLTDLNGNIAIPRQTGAATGYWVAESGAPTASQQAFDQVTLSPNTVGAYTDYSRKLMLQSSIDIEAFVRMDLARVLGLAIDLAAINGSGASNEPTGILNTTGIGDVAIGADGGAPAWQHIVELESDVAAANADIGSLRYLTTAVMRGKLKQVEKASGTAQFVWDGTEMNGYEALVSNQVPSDLVKGTSTDCHAILFGNFADLLIGMWGGLDINIDTSTGSTSGTVRVVALQDVDIAVRHAESFSAIQDARNV